MFSQAQYQAYDDNVDRRRRRIANAFTPAALGNDLYVWFDPGLITTLFQDGAATTPVAAAADPVGRINARGGLALNLQAAAGVRPLYRADGSMEFDGTDDVVTTTTITGLPTGNVAFEIFAALRQTAGTGSGTGRTLLSFGGGGGTTRITLQRNVVSSVNRMQLAVGNGSTTTTISDLNVDLTGSHVVHAVLTTTGAAFRLNQGLLPAPTAVVKSVGTTRLSLGASTSGAAFWTGKIGPVAITKILTEKRREEMMRLFRAAAAALV